MKKILTIALVALLATASVFAGISGSASVSLGYDTTSKLYGMSNSSSIDANIELSTETAEKVAEGNIYAGIKATMKLAVAPWAGVADKAHLWVDGDAHELGLWLSLKEAYVAGADWKLSITGGKGAPDYAKSAIDGSYEDNVKDDFGNVYDSSWVAESYKVSAWNATGVALTYKGFTVAGGFKGDATEATKFFAFNLFAETPKFEFEGGSVQAAAIIARDGHKDAAKKYDSLDKTNLGISAKADYTFDAFSAKVAADFGVENLSDAKVNFDVAANVAYAPVSVDVYYQYGKKLLSAKVSATIAPVTASVYTKNVLSEEKRAIGGKVEATIDAITVGANAEITLKTKEFSAGANVKYAAEKFTAKAGLNFGKTFDVDNTTVLSATASVESDAVIPGATLSLAYGKDSNGTKMNFLADQRVDQNFGAVTAKCKIAF